MANSGQTMNIHMKAITSLVALLLLFATITSAQSVRKLERKAKKTFRKEAYGMALYYSQAILKLDTEHQKALRWTKAASKALRIYNQPDELFANISPTTYAIARPEKLVEKSVETPSNLTLIVSTFNALDSSALYGTYVGVTNDGFGEGDFSQNDKQENTAVFQVPTSQFLTVTSTKNGFLSGSSTLSATDGSGKDTIYCELFLAPSWGLPIHLYFDHLQPTAASPMDSTTNLTYEDTWLDYLYRIGEYIDSNAVSGQTTDRVKAQRDVGLFFANDIDANYHKLQPFCGLLHSYLKAGKKITIFLESHTDPNEEDAHSLAARRLNSVENYFAFYESGVFQPYLAKGDLKLTRRYVATDNKEVNSPYGLEAARLRKVIVKIRE